MLGIISCGTAESTDDGINPTTTPSGDSGSNTVEPTGLATVDGCESATFLEASSDVTGKGPWEVGARTLMAGELTAEVWYPAQPGTVGETETIIYDIRDQLAPEEGARSQMRTTPGTIAIATVTFHWILSEAPIR